MLYSYTNKEQEIILQAFRGGNHVKLRDLPTSFNPQSVALAMREKTAINLTSAIKPMIISHGKGNVFHKFEWKPEEFDVCKAALSSRKKHSKQRKITI